MNKPTEVRNKSDKILGYLFKGIFIDIEAYNLISSSPLFPDVKRLGIIKKDYCKVGDTRHNDIRTYTQQDIVFHALGVLRSHGLVLRDIIFIEVNKSMLKDYDLSDTWKQKFRGITIYGCYTENGDLVGFLAMKKDYIYMIEVFKKNNGYGTRIVNSLKNIYPVISGMSVAKAKDFWIKQGAEFSPDGLYFTIKNK